MISKSHQLLKIAGNFKKKTVKLNLKIKIKLNLNSMQHISMKFEK